MANINHPPQAKYGILKQDYFESNLDEIAEQIRRLGYAILDSGYSSNKLQEISEAFEKVRLEYLKNWGESRLKNLNEVHTIRAMLTLGDPNFIELAMCPTLIEMLKKLIGGKFILNQQNGVINPPGEAYNQGSWHRDLPYQHFVSSTPLALNALFCVDDFSFENGATFVLPASHKTMACPSDKYIKENATQIQAKAGQFIVLDCMVFHSGGLNSTTKPRRAINHIYNIPYFKQQISLPNNLSIGGLSSEALELFGFGSQEPTSIQNYLESRAAKKHDGSL